MHNQAIDEDLVAAVEAENNSTASLYSTRSGSSVTNTICIIGLLHQNPTSQFYSKSPVSGGSQFRGIGRPSSAGRLGILDDSQHKHVNTPGTASSVRRPMSQLDLNGSDSPVEKVRAVYSCSCCVCCILLV